MNNLLDLILGLLSLLFELGEKTSNKQANDQLPRTFKSTPTQIAVHDPATAVKYDINEQPMLLADISEPDRTSEGRRRSSAGIASFTIPLGVVVSGLILFIGTRLAFQAQGNSPLITLFDTPLVLLLVCVGPILTVAGIVLGIRGLAVDNPKRSWAIRGLILNVLVALAFVGLWLYTFLCCW
jgi:hypothetical protein